MLEYLDADDEVDGVVDERQPQRIAMQVRRPRAGPPLCPQPGIGQIHADSGTEALEQPLRHDAFAGSDLER
jgi:hypothetical protein